MAKAGIWIAVMVALLGSVYLLGRKDCTNSYNQAAVDTLDGLLSSQQAIADENIKIMDGLGAFQIELAINSEAINSELSKEPGNYYILRRDVRLLNAARTNQHPEAISPRLTAAEKLKASTVTEQGVIRAGVECGEKYNECASKRNALIDIVRNFMEEQNKNICR